MCLFGCGCCRCFFSYLNVVGDHVRLAASSAHLVLCPAILPYTMISYLFTASLEIFIGATTWEPDHFEPYACDTHELLLFGERYTWGRIILFLDQPNRLEQILG